MQNVFDKVYFDVPKEVFYEIMENQDKGFGYKAEIKKEHLTEMQIELLDFLVKCYDKKILGKISLTFNTEAIGEVNEINRSFDKIEKTDDSFIISSTY